MKTSAFPSLATIAFFATALSASAQAATIAGWNFESGVSALSDSATGPAMTADIGTGTFRGVHASNQSDWISWTGNGSSVSYAGENNWAVGDYFEFSTSTLGFEDIMLSFDHASHPSGPKDFQLSYSTDGVNFTDFGLSYSVPRQSPAVGGVWTTTTRLANAMFSFDLSGVTDLDDTGTVYFRLTQATNINASGAAGTTARTSIDNVIISGIAVPEPSGALLGAFGLLAVLRRRR